MRKGWSERLTKWGDRIDRLLAPSVGEAPRSLEEVDRLDWELWLLVTLVMFSLLGAFILNHVPGVLPPVEMVLKPSILETYTDGLTVLVLLFCLYVIQKHRQLRQTRYKLVEAHVQEEGLKQRLSLIEVLFEFSSEVTTGDSARKAYGNVLESLRLVMDADQTSLYLLNTDTDELVLEGFQGTSALAPPNRVLVGSGYAGWVARHAEPLLLDGSVEKTRFEGLTESEHEIGSAIYVPLQVDDEIWGVLGVGVSSSEDRFTEWDLKLVHIFGNAMALSIRKNDLIDRLQESLRQNEETQLQLIQAEKLAGLGELMAGISHELNNPLGVIVGNTELMLEGELDEEIRRRLDSMNQEAMRAKRLVENLLQVARGDEVRGEEVNLNDIVEQSLSLLRYQLGLDDVGIETNLSDGLPPSVLDPFQVQQLIFNLVNNARQAMMTTDRSKRCITVKTSLVQEGAPAGLGPIPAVHLQIRDAGPGIPEEMIGRIFDPFFTTKGVGEGTGLGLSICYRVVKQFGGMIEAGNHPEGGAVFDIWLPVDSSVKPGEEEPVTGRPEADSTPQTGTVLAVEDEEKTMEVLVEILELAGHDVLTAGNGREALQVLEASEPPDVILLDLKMPVMDGREFFQKLLEEKPRLAERVLFLTGDTLSPSARSFLKSVGRPYLSKPFALDELRRAVEEIISARPESTEFSDGN